MTDEQIQATISQIVDTAAGLAAQIEYDDDAWDELYERIERLDADVRALLPVGAVAVGRYLDFTYGDGSDIYYIIDRIEGDRVHCVWVPGPDEYTADAVDSDGWTLRSIAERRIERRAWRET